MDAVDSIHRMDGMDSEHRMERVDGECLPPQQQGQQYPTQTHYSGKIDKKKRIDSIECGKMIDIRIDNIQDGNGMNIAIETNIAIGNVGNHINIKIGHNKQHNIRIVTEKLHISDPSVQEKNGTHTYIDYSKSIRKTSGLHIVPEHLHRLGHDIKMEDPRRKSIKIFELHSSVYIAIWASPSHNMSAIVLPQDPAFHHHLLPEILSQTITYILNVNKKRVQLHTHLAGALHAIPPGVAHASCNNIRVTLRKQHNYIEPLLHHLPLLDHLRQYIGRLQVDRSDWDITDPNDKRNLNTKARDFLHQSAVTPLGTQQSLRDPSTTSSSTSSNDEVTTQQPQIYIGMIGLQDDIRRETTTSHELHQPHLCTSQVSDFPEDEQQEVLQHLRRQQEFEHSYNKKGQRKAHQLTLRFGQHNHSCRSSATTSTSTRCTKSTGCTSFSVLSRTFSALSRTSTP